MRHVYDGIQQIATDIAAFPVPGVTEAAAHAMRVAEVLAGVPGRVKIATEGLEPFEAPVGWWVPPHNLAMRTSVMGPSLWVFTLLPHFPVRRAYREDLNGIVIRPVWRLASVFEPTEENVKRAAHQLQSGPTVSATVDKELTWMEHRFDIEIPKSIRAGLVANSLDQAQRRWAVDQSQIRDRLIPLDGALPRDL